MAEGNGAAEENDGDGAMELKDFIKETEKMVVIVYNIKNLI